MRPETKSFLNQLSQSTDVKQAAIADNCRFDERVTSARWGEFEDRLLDPTQLDWTEWCEVNELNYQDRIVVTCSSVPDSFLKINQKAWLEGIVTNRAVVRLENITRWLKKENFNFETLQDLLCSKDEDKQTCLANHVEKWNHIRDGRPTFAAFYDEVQSEVDDADWQHQLRDRLGLGHYHATKAPIPVALMRYSLDEVLAVAESRAIPNPFALPTVLDGGMHEYFFPVPEKHPYGATLHLVPDQADTLTAEILHYRIDYKVEHLWKIAWITRPHQIDDKNLCEARDLHLLALQEASKRPDFGELMSNRYETMA
jgi:hypothetical protein